MKKSNSIAGYLIAVSAALLMVSAIIFFPGPAQAELKKFSSKEELKNFLGQASYYGGDMFYSRLSTGMMQATTAESKAPSQDYSTTNIQVEGVDEADIVKNDGKYIYTLSGSKLVIVEAFPAESAKILSSIDAEGAREFFVNSDKLVVFGDSFETAGDVESKMAIMPPRYYSSKAFIKVYDITDRSNPALKKDLKLDGNYYNSRMIGDYVYIIINVPAYYSDDVPVPLFAPEQKAFPEIYYFDTPDSSYTYTNVVSLNLDNEGIANKVFLLGYTNNMYVSQSSIYITYMKRLSPIVIQQKLIEEAILPLAPPDVAGEIRGVASEMPAYEKQNKISEIMNNWVQSLSAEEQEKVRKDSEERMSRVYAEIAKETEKTVVHRISISNGEIKHEATGEVPGRALNQFSMDEHNGFFRIATTTGEVWNTDVKSANHIYVLDSGMKMVGKLEDLAPGEKIYSARFMGNRAYLVTFKKVDPLFVIDLTDAQNPKVLGKLKIPGYSDYLHPYDENHIIGIGKEAAEAEEGNFAWYQGVKISLFDVTDVENPKEVSKLNIGDRGTDSYALHDHKAFLFSKDRNLLVLPVLLAEKDYQYTWQGAYVFDLTLQNGFTLKGKISHNEPQGQAEKPEYYYPRYPVRRSLYIGDMLYTISDLMIKANSLGDLEEISSVDLPVEQQVYYPFIE